VQDGALSSFTLLDLYGSFVPHANN